jgi:hypothetical protein
MCMGPSIPGDNVSAKPRGDFPGAKDTKKREDGPKQTDAPGRTGVDFPTSIDRELSEDETGRTARTKVQEGNEDGEEAAYVQHEDEAFDARQLARTKHVD